MPSMDCHADNVNTISKSASMVLVFTDAEAAKAEEAIERYLGAFEAGTRSEAQGGARLPSSARDGTGERQRDGLLAGGQPAPAPGRMSGTRRSIGPCSSSVRHLVGY